MLCWNSAEPLDVTERMNKEGLDRALVACENPLAVVGLLRGAGAQVRSNSSYPPSHKAELPTFNFAGVYGVGRVCVAKEGVLGSAGLAFGDYCLRV